MKNSGIETKSSKFKTDKTEMFESVCSLTHKMIVITLTGVVITSIKVLSTINI